MFLFKSLMTKFISNVIFDEHRHSYVRINITSKRVRFRTNGLTFDNYLSFVI